MEKLFLAEFIYQRYAGTDYSDINMARLVIADDAEQARIKASQWFKEKWNLWNEAYNRPSFTDPEIYISEPIV